MSEAKENIGELEKAFEKWWHDEGSGMAPTKKEDAEEHVHRISKIAWMNGVYKANEKRGWISVLSRQPIGLKYRF